MDISFKMKLYLIKLSNLKVKMLKEINNLDVHKQCDILPWTHTSLTIIIDKIEVKIEQIRENKVLNVAQIAMLLVIF